jgi:ferric-dicitrate binding protein FerR (iron transport regulator)
MNYTKYTVEDFVLDESFQKWILSPDPQINSFWENWLLQHPDKKKMAEEAKLIICHINFKKEYPAEDEYTKVWENIIKSKAHIVNEKSANTFSFGKWYQMAAAFTGILLLGTILLYFLTTKKTSYSSEYGTIRTIMLPDSSTVILNANSKISFTTDWESQSAREVWLDGEAFFKVSKKKVKNESKKFIVHTRDLQVEVLGTEFNVSKRGSKTKVILNSGKIKLDLATTAQPNGLIMEPGELVEYSDKKDKLLKKRVNPKIYSSWIENKWILDHTPLHEVAQRIEETYGIDVLLKDENIGIIKVVGVVPTSDLDKLLQVLSATLDLKITSTNNKVIISRTQ